MTGGTEAARPAGRSEASRPTAREQCEVGDVHRHTLGGLGDRECAGGSQRRSDDEPEASSHGRHEDPLGDDEAPDLLA